jgi:hypothetical protein
MRKNSFQLIDTAKENQILSLFLSGPEVLCLKPPFYQLGQVYFLKPQPVCIHCVINFVYGIITLTVQQQRVRLDQKSDTTKTVTLLNAGLNIEFLFMKKIDNKRNFCPSFQNGCGPTK